MKKKYFFIIIIVIFILLTQPIYNDRDSSVIIYPMGDCAHHCEGIEIKLFCERPLTIMNSAKCTFLCIGLHHQNYKCIIGDLFELIGRLFY